MSRGEHRVHRLVADRRRAVEDDQVVAASSGSCVEVARDAAKNDHSGFRCAVLGRRELDEGGVGARRDHVDRRPGRRLEEVDDAQLGEPEVADRAGSRRWGRAVPLAAPLGPAFIRSVSWMRSRARMPQTVCSSRHVGQPHRVAQGRLRVEVHAQHPVAVERRGMGEVQRHRRSCRAPLKLAIAARRARLPVAASGIRLRRLTFIRRRSSLISSSENQRCRPSSSTSPRRQGGSAASRPRNVDWLTRNTSSDTSQLENRRSFFSISGLKVCRRESTPASLATAPAAPPDRCGYTCLACLAFLSGRCFP